ncbi:Fic family protein [Cloacibacillus porcorum]
MLLYTGEFQEKIICDVNNRHYRSETFTPAKLMNGVDFAVDDELTYLYATTHRLLGILDGMIKYMPNREVLKELMIFKECYYSRRIDYKEAPLFDVLASLNAGKKEYEHVAHIVTAYKAALGRQVGSRTLAETCTLAMYGEEPEEKIYLRKTTIQLSGRYDPSPPNEILPAINDLAIFIEKYNNIDILAKAALAHYQLEAIHPFGYYNGIVGRIMISMILYNAGYPSIAFLCPSQYLYYHTNDYFDLLERTRYSGGYHVWIKYFVQGICTSARHAIKQIEVMQQVIADDEAKLKLCKESTKSMWLVYNYFKQKLVSEIALATDKLNLSYNTIAKAISTLQTNGIVLQTNNQIRHKLFEYRDLLDEFTKHKK